MFPLRTGKNTYYFFSLVIVILLGILLHLYGCWYPDFIDDDTDWVIFSNSISFNPRNPVLPAFGSGHGPFTAYLIKISSLLFGKSAFGYRMLGVLLGCSIIFIIYFLARDGFGKKEAIFATSLSSFNILLIFYSKYATDDIYSVFFFALSLLLFWRALQRESKRYLLLTGIAVGLGLLTKESIFLLFVIFLIFLLSFRPYRKWLRKKELYLALGLSILISLPYIYWLFTHQFYFILPEVREWGQWFNFLNFPRAVIYLFLGYPPSLFDKNFAIGYYYMGFLAGAICIAGVFYSLRCLRHRFVYLWQLTFWVIISCEIFFFKGNPQQFIIIIIPAILLGAFLLRALWDKNIFGKALVIAALLYLAAYSSGFALTLNTVYYPLHSRISLSLPASKDYDIELNYLAKEFIKVINPYSPSLVVFADPDLDPVDNFVNSHSQIKTLGCSPENRFLPYKSGDFNRIIVFSYREAKLAEYLTWAQRNGYSYYKEDKYIRLPENNLLPMQAAVLIKDKTEETSLDQIQKMISLSMGQG